jgi:Septum formation initiator
MLNVKLRMNFFVKVTMFILICFCLILIVNLQFDLNELKKNSTSLNSQIEAYNDSIEQISEQLEQPYDDEYIERVARDKLNYRMPNEIIYFNDLIK